MKITVISSALVAALAISTAAMAQTATTAAPAGKVKSGEALYSSDGAMLGRIDYVQKGKDGAPEYVGVIYEMKMVHIPAGSLSDGQKGVVTSLSRADVRKLK